VKINRKKVAWTIGILASLLLVILVAACFLIDSVARNVLQKNLSSISGREIEIGRVSLGFIQPRIRAWDIKIHNPPGYPLPLMTSLPYLEAVYDRATLKSNHLHLSLIRIDMDRIDIHETKEGKVNLLDWSSPFFQQMLASSNSLQMSLPSPTSEKLPEPIPSQAVGLSTTNQFVLGNMVYDGITLLQVNLKECGFTSDQFPNRNMERICNLHEQYPDVRTVQDFQAIGVVLGMKTGVLFLLTDGKGADKYPLPAGSSGKFR
jgi:hypothetical protein